MKPKQCKMCGKTYEPTNQRQQVCAECRTISRKNYRKQYNATRDRSTPKPKNETKSNLDEIARNARAKGMSYGQYQAQKNMDIARVQI